MSAIALSAHEWIELRAYSAFQIDLIAHFPMHKISPQIDFFSPAVEN
jgi:hypothetical protein